jgi:hypothetical protein
MRCDAVAALLLEGKKGDELAQAVRNLDMVRNANFVALSREGSASARASLSMTTPPPYFSFPGHPAGLGLRRPSSVPLPDAWLGGYGSTMFPAQTQYPMPAMPLSHLPLVTSARPISPSPVAGISFAAQQQQSHGLLLRRPSSAQPMGVSGRRSWTTPYEGYTVMPFLQDLGIDHQFRHLHSNAQQEEAQTAGEPDYTLFSGFSFNNSQIANSASVVIPQDGSTGTDVGPHDLPPALNLSMDHIGWNGEIDPALDSASSLASSSTTLSSHESSPTPSDNERDLYTASENGLFAGSNQMFTIDANYDLGLTSFDISPLDHLATTFSHDSTYSFDAANMQGLMEGMQPVDPILHAPKPMLANECTPTKMVFGEHLGVEEFNIH